MMHQLNSSTIDVVKRPSSLNLNKLFSKDLCPRILSKNQWQQMRQLRTDSNCLHERLQLAEQAHMSALENQIKQAVDRAYQSAYAAAVTELISVSTELRRAANEQQAEIIKLMFAALESMLGQLPDGLVSAQMTKTALDQQVDTHAVIAVIVHPDVYGDVSAKLREWQQANEVTRVELRADPSKSVDDCEIETTYGTVRAGLHSQLATLRKSLLHACAAGDA